MFPINLHAQFNRQKTLYRRHYLTGNGSHVILYRVMQEESEILWEMIVCVILSKKVHMNMGPILNCYGVMTA